MVDKAGNKTGGRKKGTPNKATADVRKAIVEAFEKRNTDQKWLEKLDDKTFAMLVAKVVPAENINRNYDMSALADRIEAARDRVMNDNKASSKRSKSA